MHENQRMPESAHGDHETKAARPTAVRAAAQRSPQDEQRRSHLSAGARLTHDDQGVEAQLQELEARGWVFQVGHRDTRVWGIGRHPSEAGEIRVVASGVRIETTEVDGVVWRRRREQGRLARVGSRKRHPHERLEAELRDAEADGWVVTAFENGPLWGRIESPDGRDRMWVFDDRSGRNMERHRSKIWHARFRQYKRGRAPASGKPAVENAFIEFRAVTQALINAIARDPELLDRVHHRAFEELVAELLDRQGFTVELTPPSGDRGVDIYARRVDEFGPSLYVVECKHHEAPIGPDFVRMLYGVVERERATKGILAASTTFTPGALDEARTAQNRISLRDRDAIIAWVRRSGLL